MLLGVAKNWGYVRMHIPNVAQADACAREASCQEINDRIETI